jgi:hypothetical protein
MDRSQIDTAFFFFSQLRKKSESNLFSAHILEHSF